MVGNSDEEPRTDDSASGSTLVITDQMVDPISPIVAPGNAVDAVGVGEPGNTLGAVGLGEQARLDADAPFRPPLNGNSTGPLPVRPVGSLAATAVLPPEPSGAALVIEPVPSASPVSAAELPPVLSPALPPVEPPVFMPPRRPWVSDEPLLPVPHTAPPVAGPAPVIVTAPPAVAAAVVAPPLPAAPVAVSAPPPAAPPPTGALVLLPGEEVVLQLGALYLTTRRAILYAPTILRATFLADIDAVGTVTERSGGWMFLIGLISLGAGAAAAYVGLTQPGIAWQLGEFLQASPLLIAIPLIALGLFTLASYFFWVKRSLFLSVGGRPLIVVSVTGWSAKKLEPVDQFVNAFSAAKDRDLRQG